MDNRAIGFIDSGIGGLTVVKESFSKLPNEQVYYVGDTKRMPYGPRPAEEVVQFTFEMANFLIEQKNIKMLVVACNTATARALPDLKQKLTIPVIGVIQPGVFATAKTTKNKKIGVIATKGTVESNVYANQLENNIADVQVTQLAAPEFVEIVEANEYETPKAKQLVEQVLKPLKNKSLDTLVLGCTHFPLLQPFIQEAMGDSVKLVDSGKEAIGDVVQVLDELRLRKESKTLRVDDEYFTTGDVEKFHKLATHWLKDPQIAIQHLSITNDGLKR